MERIQEAALSLLNRGDKIHVDPINKIGWMIEFFKKNKISFLELSNALESRDQNQLFQAEEFKKTCALEQKRHEDWRRDFIQIKKEWDKFGIDFIFIKSTSQFPHMSDNLDVLVRTKDFKKAGDILDDKGYVELRNVQEPHKRLYRRFTGNGEGVPIHLHERVCWAVPYENNEHLWSHYIVSDMDELIHYPCKEDAVLIHTAHCFLEDHLVKIYDLLAIKKSTADSNLSWQYIVTTADEMHWLHALFSGFLIFDFLYCKLFNEALISDEILREARKYVKRKWWIHKTLERKIFINDFSMPFEVPHAWTRIHSSLRVLNDPGFGKKSSRYILVFKHLLDGFLHLKLGWHAHPKMLVAFAGLDGSGKTRHCKSLHEAFRSCEIDALYLWSRAGSLPVTRLFLKGIRFLKPKKERRKDNFSQIQNKGWLRNRFTIWAWRVLNSADLIIHYFLKVTIPLIFRKVVIADRYINDSIIDMEGISSSVAFGRFIYKILKALTPSPDLIFFLDLAPDVIVQRGGEKSKDELIEEYGYYKSCLSNEQAIYIDNSKPFYQVNKRIVRTVLKKFFAEYPEKYDGYRLISLRYK